VIVNEVIALARAFAPHSRRLRRRAARAHRVPVVIVPPMLGTRLRDTDGRKLWGFTRNLFAGPPVGGCPGVVTDGLLEALRLIPGVYARDVHGAMVSYLEKVGGYRLGRDLFVLTYDWRRGVVDAAAALANFVAALTDAGHEGPVDLVALSSGGLAARYFLLHGGHDVIAASAPDAAARAPSLDGEAAARRVRRVVYLGTPQRGALSALIVLANGFCLVPWVGRRYAARDTAMCQIAFDLLPHPDDEIAVDERLEPMRLDLYAARTWHELGLAPDPPADLAAKLERARRLHRALDRAGPPADAVVIGARHRPTRARILVRRGRADVDECWLEDPAVRSDARLRAALGRPGDGTVTTESLTALPGGARVDWVAPGVHHDLPSDPRAHVAVLEALL
jgi:hypothetical protein